MAIMEYVSSREIQGVLVIGFPSAAIVDPVAVQMISEEVMARVENADCRRLILDFTGVSFITSELVGKMVGFRRYCQTNGISLKLAGLPASFRRVLELTKLSTQFKTYHTLNSALEMFGADDFMVRQEFFAAYANSPSDEFSGAVAANVPLRMTSEGEPSVFCF